MIKLFITFLWLSVMPAHASASGNLQRYPNSCYRLLYTSELCIFILILLLCIIGYIIYYAFKRKETKTFDESSQEPTMETRQKQYENGSITKNELDQLNKDLKD